MRHIQTPFLLALCALLFLCTPVFSQEPLPDAEQAMAGIRPHAIRAHMRFLADDLLEGRDTATRGYDLAARYVASAFETIGLEPAGTKGTYLQPVPLLRVAVDESKCSMSLSRNRRKTKLKYGKDYVSDYVAEPDSSITAPVVFVGFGITAPELNHDDYAGIDARGKIAAFLTGGPASFPEPRRTWYSDRRRQARNAIDHGAVGVLVIPTPELQRIALMEVLLRMTRTPTLVWANEKGQPGLR
ncbi:MAG TPA: peptidase M28, partial [Thermoanaerobaculia bacterium]